MTQRKKKPAPGRRTGTKWDRPGMRAYESGELPPGEITFEVATDWIHDGHERYADLLGRALTTIPRMRMDPGHSGYRDPPPGWELILAARARERERQMREIAVRLEGQASQKDAAAK